VSYLRYLCLFAYSGIQHILCCGFALFFFVYVASFSGLSIFDCPFGILKRLLHINYTMRQTFSMFVKNMHGQLIKSSIHKSLIETVKENLCSTTPFCNFPCNYSFNYSIHLRQEEVVGGIVDHHCLSLLIISMHNISNVSLPYSISHIRTI